MVFNSHEEAADAWLGGDSPWVRRIIGITPAPEVGSLYNEGIWDSDAAVWRGKDVATNMSIPAGTPKASKQHILPPCTGRLGWGVNKF